MYVSVQLFGSLRTLDPRIAQVNQRIRVHVLFGTDVCCVADSTWEDYGPWQGCQSSGEGRGTRFLQDLRAPRQDAGKHIVANPVGNVQQRRYRPVEPYVQGVGNAR